MNEVLRLAADDADFVEVECVLDDSFDLLLMVRVSCRQFTATIDTWVARDAWFAFAQQTTILEETRKGDAHLESMSPQELDLTIRALDPAGHMGVEGTVGTRRFDGEAVLKFSAIGFDPSQLVAFTRAARRVSEALGAARSEPRPG